MYTPTEEKDVLVQEIIQKVYPELKPINLIPVVTTVEKKEFISFLKQCITKHLRYILKQINHFECWYNEQILTDDLKDAFCKNSGWTLDQATSLILGKNPNEVILDKLVKMFENIFVNTRLSKEIKKNLIHPIISNYKAQRNQIDLAIEFKKITGIESIYLNDNYVLFVPPQKVLKWCKEKEIKLPDGIEELIEKYHNYQDKETKYQKLEAENQELKKEKDKSLTIIEALNKKVAVLEEDKPNTKILNSYKQLAMGMLAVHYGEEQVKIWQNWTNEAVLNKSSIKQKELLFTRIEEDLAKLNARGIKIKRDAIGDKIKESINLLKVKKI